ncbi:MAG: hypothetical protein E6Q93_02345 [Burkholderiaceae bacterium]|jgi:hypothetical protein|nr:MAG: hypothetical protein E6Q93_02345 [Burkholderiaceae bacterium]
MSAGQATVQKPIRLVFELARADNPRLFDELNQFPQGQKRVNRLRVLAYDGLLAQYGVFAPAARGVGSDGPTRSVDVQTARVTNGLFEPALKE